MSDLHSSGAHPIEQHSSEPHHSEPWFDTWWPLMLVGFGIGFVLLLACFKMYQ